VQVGHSRPASRAALCHDFLLPLYMTLQAWHSMRPVSRPHNQQHVRWSELTTDLFMVAWATSSSGVGVAPFQLIAAAIAPRHDLTLGLFLPTSDPLAC